MLQGTSRQNCKLACAFGAGQIDQWRFERPPARSAGYAIVDAMVAMLVLSMTIILSLRANHQARAIAEQATDVQRAHVTLAHLLETAPRRFDDAEGDNGVFHWEVTTRTTGGERPIEVCQRRVVLTNQRTGRAYEAQTLEICPVIAP